MNPRAVSPVHSQRVEVKIEGQQRGVSIAALNPRHAKRFKASPPVQGSNAAASGAGSASVEIDLTSDD